MAAIVMPAETSIIDFLFTWIIWTVNLLNYISDLYLETKVRD